MSTPKRFFFDTTRAYTPAEIDALIAKHGPNIVLGGNPEIPGHQQAMDYARKRGAKTHDYYIGAGEPARGYGGDGKIRFPSDQNEIARNSREIGISRDAWDRGGWMDWHKRKLMDAKARGAAPYSIEIDNTNAGSPDEYVKMVAGLQDWKRQNGIDTKLMLKNALPEYTDALDRAMKSGQIRSDYLAPYKIMESYANDAHAGRVGQWAQSRGITQYRYPKSDDGSTYRGPADGIQIAGAAPGAQAVSQPMQPQQPMQAAAPGAGGLSGINKHQLAFLRGLGMTESGFRRKEAYAEYLNTPQTNANVRKYGPSGADYGFYQTNARDVADAIRLGVSPEIAKHLHGGGRGGTSTAIEQTSAMHEYLQRRYSSQYGALTSGSPEAFEAARQKMAGQWFGLRDNPHVARREFTRGGDPNLFNETGVMARTQSAPAGATAPKPPTTMQGQPQQPTPSPQQMPDGDIAPPPPGASQQQPQTQPQPQWVNGTYGQGIQWGDGSTQFMNGSTFKAGALTSKPAEPPQAFKGLPNMPGAPGANAPKPINFGNMFKGLFGG